MVGRWVNVCLQVDIRAHVGAYGTIEDVYFPKGHPCWSPVVWPMRPLWFGLFGQDADLRGASGLMCSGMSGEGRGGFCFVRYAEEAMAAECVAKAPPSLYLY